MKKILFRAKVVGSGRWVYGSLIEWPGYCCILERPEDLHDMDHPYLDDDIGWIDGKATPVDPKTISRFIEYPCYGGFREQDIFEGDIVEIYDSKCDIELTEPRDICVVVDEHCITKNGLGRCFPQDTIQVNVIGNVWDNPELVTEKYADLYLHYFGHGVVIR